MFISPTFFQRCDKPYSIKERSTALQFYQPNSQHLTPMPKLRPRSFRSCPSTHSSPPERVIAFYSCAYLIKGEVGFST